MVSHIVRYLIIVLWLVESNAQSLNKSTLFIGLNTLQFSSLRVPSYTVTPAGTSQNLCNCGSSQLQTVQNIHYDDQSIILCMCQNPVMSADYMIDMMGRVPYVLRRNVKAIVSSTVGECGGARAQDDVLYFCEKNMHVSVFIHEAAHSFDKGKSASPEWYNAVAQDTCVPDPYATTNYVEDFAQVAVVWADLIDKTYGSEYDCMKNQLRLMWRYTAKLSCVKPKL